MDTSGKSKELNKLFNRKDELFNTSKNDFIYISYVDSISELLFKNITNEDIISYLNTFDEEERKFQEKNINKQFFKIETLKYKTKNAYLFVDDIDKFTGKKLEILKSLVRSCKILFASSKSEKTINKTIFSIIEQKKYNCINLKTHNSFDVTNYALIGLMIPFAISGQYMVVMMLLLANRYLDKGMGK